MYIQQSIIKYCAPTAGSASLQTAWPPRRYSHLRISTGFTLLEVLVVVAIIALLVSILVPSLKRAREQATASACMSNMRQLTLAMHMYVAEHKRLPGSFSVLFTSGPGNARGICGQDWFYWESWLGLRYSHDYGGLYFNISEPPPHSTADLWRWVEETVPHKGTIYKYAKNKDVYLCPKDRRGFPDPDEPMGGGGNGVFSYTMNYLLGFSKPEDVSSFRYVADFNQVPAALEAPYPTIKAGTRMVWSASKMILLMEEHPWNNTNQSIPMDDLGHSSYLVMRHHPHVRDGQGIFAFLDGHVAPKRYPYRGDRIGDDGKRIKLQGLDILNEYRYPYSYSNLTGDGGDNEREFVHQIKP